MYVVDTSLCRDPEVSRKISIFRNFAKFLQRHRFRNMKHWSADVARRAGSAEQS